MVKCIDCAHILDPIEASSIAERIEEVDESRFFCRERGLEVIDDPFEERPCRRFTSGELQDCPKCGKPTPIKWKQCMHCGEKIRS